MLKSGSLKYFIGNGRTVVFYDKQSTQTPIANMPDVARRVVLLIYIGLLISRPDNRKRNKDTRFILGRAPCRLFGVAKNIEKRQAQIAWIRVYENWFRR